MKILDLFLYIVIGLLIGILSSFFGVGGGFVLTPLLHILGFPIVHAVGTSLFYTIGTSSLGTLKHIRLKNVRIKEAVIIGIFGFSSVQIVFPLINYLDKLGYSDIIVNIGYLIFLGYFALDLTKKHFFNKDKNIKDNVADEKEIYLSNLTEKRNHLKSKEYLTLIAIGLIAGILSITLGVGGGFVVVPLLIKWRKYPFYHAVGTSLLSIIFISSYATFLYTKAGDLIIMPAILMVIGAFVGIQIGGKGTEKINEKTASFLLAILFWATFLSVLLKMFNFSLISTILIFSTVVLINIFIIKNISTLSKKQVRSKE